MATGDVEEHTRTEEALWERTRELAERVKELNCLYGISSLVETPGISLEEVLQGIAAIVPQAWRYPEVACARIIVDGQKFKTENFRETAWRQVSDIKVHGRRVGSVEVCYLEERPESYEGPFLKEERGLLDAVAERLRHIIEHMRAEEALWERTGELAKRVKELNCLYGISSLVETPGISPEKLLQGVAAIIPQAWQYPEIACARIIVDGQKFKTENFRETAWRQVSDIKVHGRRVGSVEVCYLEERPESYEGPFGEEERGLLGAVAERIGHIVERMRAEEALRERTRELVELPGASLEDLLQRTANIIPRSWQHADIACARIVLEDRVFKTENFRETAWRQVSDIKVHGRPVGSVEVCYLEERPESYEGPFLEEERGLLDAVAEQLGHTVDHLWAEEEARRERQRLETLVETSPVGIVVVDAGGRVVLVNREAERITDFTCKRGDPLETIHQGTVRRHPDGTGYAPEELPISRALHQGETVRAEEMWFLLADGRTVPALVDATPIQSAHGRITGAIATIQDITPLEEAERLRSEFLGMVSHELKTPLTAIKGSAAMALGGQGSLDAAKARGLFQIIDGQTDRLTGLVDNLLDMTRIEAGFLAVSPAPTDLRSMLEEARAAFVRGGGSQEVEIRIPEELPAVNADRERGVQVVSNLLGNAAKFSREGEQIIITADSDATHVGVHVHDRGLGIPEGKLPHLFKKFSQVHQGEVRGLPGSGLGLAICKGIVEAHGGRIWAESEGEGRGSTFSFTLPVASEAGVPSRLEAARKATPRITRASERPRILAVDDEPEVLRYLRRALGEAGYEALVTTDPQEVLRRVELEEPELLLLDLMLPRISGFELLQRVREISSMPIIVLTASRKEEHTVRALEMGADDYITKPFSPSELLARIGAAFRRRRSPESLQPRPPFVLDDLSINFAERLVEVQGQAVSLSATQYKLLYELAIHAGQVLTHDQILQRVWGPGYSGETGLLRSFIRDLRMKLGDDARQPRYIRTERNVGYRMRKPKL